MCRDNKLQRNKMKNMKPQTVEFIRMLVNEKEVGVIDPAYLRLRQIIKDSHESKESFLKWERGWDKLADYKVSDETKEKLKEKGFGVDISVFENIILLTKENVKYMLDYTEDTIRKFVDDEEVSAKAEDEDISYAVECSSIALEDLSNYIKSEVNK